MGYPDNLPDPSLPGSRMSYLLSYLADPEERARIEAAGAVVWEGVPDPNRIIFVFDCSLHITNVCFVFISQTPRSAPGSRPRGRWCGREFPIRALATSRRASTAT